MNNVLKKIAENKVYIFIILSLFLMVINHLFYIDEYIAIPQFAHFKHWEYCMKEISRERLIYFYSYFMIDALWAFFLLWLMYNIVVEYCCKGTLQEKFKGTPVVYLTQKWTYQNLFAFTWLADIGENISYIVLKNYIPVDKGYLPSLVSLKFLLYAVCLLIFLIVLYKKYIKSDLGDLNIFWKSALLSLFFLGIIAVLLTQMEQGSSLIIALLDSPYNLAIVLLMLINLSIVFSHYPVYILFYYFKKENDTNRIWERATGGWRSGIIHFTENEQDENWLKIDKKYKNFRYFLGALVFISFIYSLFFTFDKYIVDAPITFKVIIITILVLIGLKHYFDRLESKNIKRLSKIYLINHCLSWIFMILALVSSYFFGWHWATFFVTFLFLMSRSVYTFLNRKNNQLSTGGSLSKFLFQVHKMEFGDDNSHIKKLTFIKWSGFIASAIFAASHFPSIGMNINPILIILCYVHLAYGLILILLKNYMYYASKSTVGTEITFSRTFSFISKNTIIILLILFGVKYYWNRNINQIQYLKEYNFNKKETIEVDSFINTFNQTHSKDSVRYYISSWGGGLRATYFNLLLLDKKQKESGNTFLNKVVAMSGVSGGSLGLSLFFSTKKENLHNGDIKISEIFDNIGNSNFASTDLAYLLGRDRLPFNQWLSRDRSIVGMNNYWSLITSRRTSFDTTSYQTYWKEGNERLGYFPLLITNTTKTSGNYGVAFSAYADKKKFDSIFKGATNILDLPDSTKSLSFFEAVSTSERFPFFSATASIRGRGHYIDGGYFDNSGLTSLMNLKNYVNSRESLVVVEGSLIAKDSLIILGNSKSNLVDYYLAHSIMIDKNDRNTLKIRGETDYGAILKGILNTDRLSNFLSDQHGVFGKNAKMINLPYHLRYTDFIKALGGEPQDLKDIESIRKLIKENNDAINNAINEYIKKGNPNINHRSKPLTKWDFAYPTLSRYLSRPTVNYYKAMIAYHESLKF